MPRSGEYGPRRRLLAAPAHADSLAAWINRYLEARLREGLLGRVLAGDVLQKTDSGGIFSVADAEMAEAQGRVDSGAVVVTGPMFGSRMRAPTPGSASAAREEAVLRGEGLTLEEAQARFANMEDLLGGLTRIVGQVDDRTSEIALNTAAINQGLAESRSVRSAVAQANDQMHESLQLAHSEPVLLHMWTGGRRMLSGSRGPVCSGMQVPGRQVRCQGCARHTAAAERRGECRRLGRVRLQLRRERHRLALSFELAADALQLVEHRPVLGGVGQHRHVLPVLGRAAHHGRAADIDVLDGVFQRATGLGHGGLERVQVHHQEVDGVDACVDRGIENAARFLIRGGHTTHERLRLSERHRAQGKRRDLQTAPSEIAMRNMNRGRH